MSMPLRDVHWWVERATDIAQLRKGGRADG